MSRKRYSVLAECADGRRRRAWLHLDPARLYSIGPGGRLAISASVSIKGKSVSGVVTLRDTAREVYVFTARTTGVNYGLYAPKGEIPNG